jgi:pyruvate-formate lyase-activating enzyme
MRIALINPPIYDFAAYDFWLKPYGLLSVGGMLRGRAEMALFDFLACRTKTDSFGRGPFPHVRIPKPAAIADIPRHFYRFGRDQRDFQQFLAAAGPFDLALIQTTMTWWYPGVAEVIAEVRRICPSTKIVLGGIYATLCPEHASTLGADIVVSGTDLAPLQAAVEIPIETSQPALWECCQGLDTGVLKITDGCPFRCTYCATPHLRPQFVPRNPEKALGELELMLSLGAGNIAFYDDALLYRAEEILVPFLREAAGRGLRAVCHTPNGLHARYVTRELAETLVRSGFRTFYLGYESASPAIQRSTGGKVADEDLATAVKNLLAAGAQRHDITAYILAGHPASSPEDIEASMLFVHSLGVRISLSDFAPIPGTPDGEAAGRLTDMAEPLNHNKTAWPIRFLGNKVVNRLKDLCRSLNRQLSPASGDSPDGS